MERIGVVLFLAVGIFSTSAYGYEFPGKQFVSNIIDKTNNFLGKQKQSDLSLDLPENAFPTEHSGVSFVCHHDGLYSYPADCTLGVRCKGGMETVFSCTDVMHFNNVTKKCENFCSARCDPLLACICGWDSCRTSSEISTTEETETNELALKKPKTSFTCLPDGLFPDPLDCNQYIQCLSGRAYSRMCPFGLHFSKEAERCERPCDAACDPTLACKQKSSETSTEMPTTDLYKDKPRTSSTCQSDGLFAFPGNCNWYFECLHGGLNFRTCPRGLHFHKKTKKCKRPCKAKCDPSLSCRKQMNQVSTTETPTSEDFTTSTSTESKKMFKLKLKFVCFYDGLFPSTKDCSKYIKCSNGTSYELSCPPGQHFNNERKRCETPCSAKCDPNLTCSWRKFKQDFIFKEVIDSLCSKDGIYKSPVHCGTYFKCEAGDINAFLCPNGQHFNIETLKCEEPCDAHCDPSIAEKCGWSSSDFPESDTGEYLFASMFDAVKDESFEVTPKELCSKKGLYAVKNPLDCTTFFKCWNGDVELLDCPEGGHFIEETMLCGDPCEAHCNSSFAEKCGWKESENALFQSLKQPIFDFECPGNGVYANTACENFIQCTGGQPYLINCPHGQHFEPYSGRCTTPCEARCAPNYEEFCKDEVKIQPPKMHLKDFTCDTDGYHTNPLDCGSFIQCFDGSAYVIYCPADLHYSPTLEICMSRCDAKCAPNYEEYCREEEWRRRRKLYISSNSSAKQPFPLVSEFICTKDGLYPNPEECNSFIHCMNGETIIVECPEGRHFSEKTETCKLPCEAHCASFSGAGCEWDELWAPTENTQDTTFEDDLFTDSDSPGLMYHFTCMTDGIFKNPENCSTFIQCAGGHSYIMACPEGLHFNEEVKTCDYPCAAHCDVNRACDCGWDTCDRNAEIFEDVDCEVEPDEGPCKGRFPRYAYDVGSGRCRGFYYGGCGGNSNNFKTMEECEKKCRKKILRGYVCPEDNGMFGNFPDCTSYYHCKRGIPFLKRCPKGTAFDHIKSKCVTEYEAKCIYECREENAVYPYEQDCSKYIDCVNGIPKLEKCPPGKAFDPDEKDCIDEKQVKSCLWDGTNRMLD